MDARAILTPPHSLYTSHPLSRFILSHFAKGCGGQLLPVEAGGSSVACYGVLRGCMEAMKASDDFWYIDHGAFGRGTYYRVVRNGFWLPSTPSSDDARFKKLGVTLKDWRTNGDHIVVVPPTEHAERHHGLKGWLDAALLTLNRYTDRPIVVHTKQSPVPLKQVLRGAWALLTDHSNAAIDALVEGIPAVMTNPQRSLGSIAEIESPPMRRDFFASLANNQWSLAEMASGEQWKHAESSAGLHRLR